MSAITELIRLESNGTISFGDYTLAQKAKLDNFEYLGGIYKVKTYKEITKLECDEMFVYESVPGTAVSGFSKSAELVTFSVEGPEDAQITIELEEDAEYEVSIDGNSVGTMATNMGGKLSFSVEIAGVDSVSVKIEKK